MTTHTARASASGGGRGGGALLPFASMCTGTRTDARAVCVCALGVKRSKRGGYAEMRRGSILPARLRDTHRPRARPGPQVERGRALPGRERESAPTPKKKRGPFFDTFMFD